MVEVESYLQKKDSFIPIGSYQGGVKDSHYIEGAIRLKINGVEVIDLTMWDYVDMLWDLILNVVEQVDRTGKGEIYWPDQPITLHAHRLPKSEDIIVTVNCHATMRVRVNYNEFRYAILEGARRFFGCMSGIVPENSASYEQSLQRIAKLTGSQN